LERKLKKRIIIVVKKAAIVVSRIMFGSVILVVLFLCYNLSKPSEKAVID